MGARELTFDADRHEYRFLGARVPSVTQVLAPLIDLSGIPRPTLEAKRDLGQRVHAACQYDAEDDLDESSVEDDVRPYLEGWRRFLRETGAVVLRNEQQVCDPLLMVAGTLDRVVALNGNKYLADIKTSIATPMTTGPQTCAYQRLLGDTSVTHRAAIRLRPDGTYRFDPLTDANDWAVFMACLTLYRWKEANA